MGNVGGGKKLSERWRMTKARSYPRGHGRVFVNGEDVGTIAYCLDAQRDQVGGERIVGLASCVNDALRRAAANGGKLELQDGRCVRFEVTHYDESTSRLLLLDMP
jgi:hypothetical protein